MMTQINTLIGNQVTLATWQNISSEKNYGGKFIETAISFSGGD